MGAYISAFVVRVDGQVQAHQLLELLVFITQHMRKVGAPVQVALGLNVLTSFVFPTVNIGSYLRQARNQVHYIFVGRLPVFFLESPS